MFIQVVQGRATDPAGWRKQIDSWSEQVGPVAQGFLGATSGIRDDGSFITVVRFESAEKAQANSNLAEQGKWFEELSQYITDVSFKDCNEVIEWLGGGSDDAGFVQVIQGKVADPQKMIDEMKAEEATASQDRPDVIGGIVALHGDGGFTNVVYFTSEAAAREGEKSEASKERTDSAWEQVEDLSFFDISEPILRS